MNTEPRLYVGTYAKYNNGSIAGKWLDLADYADKDEFMAAARELHKDEHDPELMFQDFEGFPRSFYGESYIPEELWDWLALDEDDRELLAVYQDEIDGSGTIEEARASFIGKADSPAAWAESWLEDTGQLAEVPPHLRNYIDFESYARDQGYDGITFVRKDGEVWVFT